MKTKWTIGLLAAAVAAVAVVSGIASATTLCEANTNECPAGQRYGVPQKLQASAPFGVPFTLIFGEVEVECNESKITAETKSNEGKGKALTVEVGAWSTFQAGGKECESLKPAVVKCPTKWTNPPYKSVHITATGGGNGKILLATVQTPTVEVSCSGTKCIYAGEITFTITGGEPAKMKTETKNLQKQTGSNILCAKEATLIAEYEFTEPKKMWVQSEP